MAGKPRAECKIVSEQSWALAREDYLSGMSAQAVCERHGMGVAGLRGRAHREGWTKAAHAAANAPALAPPASDASGPPLTQEGIARSALARASAALTAGRPAEAEAIVRTLDHVLALAADLEPEPDEVTLGQAMDRNRKIWRTMTVYAEELAEHMLGDGEVYERHARRAFAWRAAHLGPEAEARDRAYAERMGWAEWLYDAEGRLTPDPEAAGDEEIRQWI